MEINITRPKKSEKHRFFCLLFLFLVVFISSLLVGPILEAQFLQELRGKHHLNWAQKRYISERNQLPRASKNTNYRVLYLSNSHAFTGGNVYLHLQELLNELFPGEYEVINMSAPGMFAPEFLQRFLSVSESDIDTVILPVAYISFSDLMKLKNQALTSHSFFKPDVFPKLPITFWLRHYDIDLYLNKLLERHVSLYKYRNDLRDYWEKPLVNILSIYLGNRPYRFLEVDEFQSWKFPDGFDNKLFDWNLYSLKRKNHLNDLENLVSEIKRHQINLLPSNLPIDFEKDPHPVNTHDYRIFRTEISNLFHSFPHYIDYQDIFPKEFTTYDALHPTWHGARLHALHFLLQLNRLREKPVKETTIYSHYQLSRKHYDQFFYKMLDDNLYAETPSSMRRYDIFETSNAKELLSRFLATSPGSDEENTLLNDFAVRIRYWKETNFQVAGKESSSKSELWNETIASEISSAKNRAHFFAEKLEDIQKRRLEKFPVPHIDSNSSYSTFEIHISSDILITLKRYKIEKNIYVNIYIDKSTGKTISYSVFNNRNSLSYTRTDLLGNNSFIQLSFSPKIQIPYWVDHKQPFKKFGI